MKLLVLGASSQLGRELTSLLQRRGIDHVAMGPDELDLLQHMEVIKTISSIAPRLVINAAAYSNVAMAETDPEAARQCDILNSQGVSTLAQVCEHLNIPLIHHSSSYVFDGMKKAPYREDDATDPLGRYGMSKWYGERAIREILPHHIILRTDWMFSVHRDRLFREHIETCRRSGGGTEVMDHRFSPTPADDVARVLLAIAQQVDCQAEVWGTYHYCALQPLSEAQFVEHFLREAAAWDPLLAEVIDHLAFDVVPPVKPFIANSSLHCQKIMETFGIKQRSRAAGLTFVLEEIYREGGQAGASGESGSARVPAPDSRGHKPAVETKQGARKLSAENPRPPARKGARKKSSPSP